MRRDMPGDYARRDQVAAATAAAEETMRPQTVPVNVYETTGALVVLAPLPAVTPRDVTIEIRPGAVRFWAHLRSAGPRDFVLHEWEYGCYEREIELPAGVRSRAGGDPGQRPAGHPGPSGRLHPGPQHSADGHLIPPFPTFFSNSSL